MMDLNINKDSELHKIGLHFWTDKAYQKKHTFLYDALFKKFGFEKEGDFTLLELGVGHGHSHLMWHRYYLNATIVGVDHRYPSEYFVPRYMDAHQIKDGWFKCYDENGIERDKSSFVQNLMLSDDRFDIVKGDQRDMKLLGELQQKYGSFDIIIDDASHHDDLTKGSFACLYPFLRPGGLYIIEDLELGGSKSQHKTRNDLENYSSTRTFKHLKNYDNIESVELLFSQNYMPMGPAARSPNYLDVTQATVAEAFVLGVIRKKK